MEYCPVCKSDILGETKVCTVCNAEIEIHENKWIMIGAIEDKISSDYADETLKSNNIPVVIISKSGFFGTIGMSLNNFYSSEKGMFEVSVPEEFAEEATDILDMILSESWIKKE